MKFLNNPKFKKICITTFIAIIFIFTAFLTTNLFLFYNKNIKNREVKLYYDFKPNTVTVNNFLNYSNTDISEQFLSYGISYGIDVSEWQGSINWEKVKKTGISFAMIRCGYRQTEGSEIHEDARFKENIEGATKAGLTVGVYFFGTAKNEKEALEEAEFTINLIKDYNLTYPVAYDAETFDQGRLQNIDYSTISNNILTFTETIGSYGYDTMVYSYHDAFIYKLDMGKFDGKLIWLSHFSPTTGYNGNFNMWQYTSEGHVDGITTKVDLNISYFKYVDNEEDVTINPNYKHANDIPVTLIDDSIKTTSKTTLRTSPTTSIPNKYGYINKGITLKRTGYTEDFSRVNYNGRTLYISNDDLVLINTN